MSIRVLPMVVVLMAVMACSSPETGPVERTETWSDGSLREKWIEVTGPDDRQVRHGPYTKWWKGDQKSEEGEFVNGVLHGEFTKWHPNGQKSEAGEMHNGEYIGMYTAWYDSGQKRSEGNHIEGGLADGVHSGWWPDGKPAYVFHYLGGKKQGLQEEWHENGRLKKKGEYKNGLALWYQEWAEDGNLTSQKGDAPQD